MCQNDVTRSRSRAPSSRDHGTPSSRQLNTHIARTHNLFFKSLSNHPWWTTTTLFTTAALLLIAVRSTLSNIDREYSVALETAEAETLALEIRRREKDFIQRRDPKYLELFEQDYDGLKSHLAALESTPAVLTAELTEIRDALGQYRNSFARYAELTIEIGITVESGLQGYVNSQAHALETRVKGLRAKNLLLRLRRATDRFIQDRREIHIQQFDELIETARNETPSVQWTAYSDAVHQLEHAMSLRGLNENSGLHGKMRAAFHRMEPLLHMIGQRASTRAVANVATLKTELLSIFLLVLITSGVGISLLYTGYKRHGKLAQSLGAKESELRVTLESLGEAVVTTNPSGRIQFLNIAAERLTGWTRSEAEGQHIDDVIKTADSQPGQIIPTPRPDDLKSTQSNSSTHQTVLIRRDGDERDIRRNSAPIIDNGRNVRGAVLVLQDITDQIRLEADAQQGKRLETVGLLAGGLAHDFNNLLTAIINATDLLSIRIGNGQSEKELLEIITQSGKNAASLTTKLLALSRHSPRISMVFDAHALIENTRAVINRTIDKDITFDCELNAEPSSITGDPSLISSVFLNIAMNASEAMPTGGRLEVRTSIVTGESRDQAVTNGDSHKEKRLKITFKDDGHGMSRSTLQQIFEPYFTTKPQGTGLGLSSSFSAVKEHHGTITVRSTLGQGSTFTILLPIARAPQSAPKKVAPPRLPRTQKQREVILIVDDQDSVRSTAAKMLQSIGFETETAHNGETGISMVRNNPNRYAAVLLDMILPDILGSEVFDQLIESDPDLPILMFSGYVGAANIDQLIKRGMRGFLQKPFDRGQLQRAITQAIESQAHKPTTDNTTATTRSLFSAMKPGSNEARSIQSTN